MQVRHGAGCGAIGHCFEPVGFSVQELREGPGKSGWRIRATEPVSRGWGSKPDPLETVGLGSWLPEWAIILSPLLSSLGTSASLVAVRSVAHPSGAGPSRRATSVRGRQPPLPKLGAHAEQLSLGQGLSLGWGQPPRDRSWSSTPCQGPCPSSLSLWHWLLLEERLAGDLQEQAAQAPGHLPTCGLGGRVQKATVFAVGTVEQGVFPKWHSACTHLIVVSGEGRVL